MASLLQLPGEIRNQIYQCALVKAKPFVVKLQFFPHETALFRVNKQIYEEASTIFYHYNIFSFPQALFDGSPILEKLENFIRLPLWRLATLKNLKIDVPVSPNEAKPAQSISSLIEKKSRSTISMMPLDQRTMPLAMPETSPCSSSTTVVQISRFKSTLALPPFSTTIG